VKTRRIFLARHGNREDLVNPAWEATAEEPYDPPLSADGEEQARRLGQRLAREGIEAIISSPFLRTIQTAHHANEALDVPIYVEPGFGEWLSEHSFTRPPRLQSLAALARLYPSLRDGHVPAASARYPETAEQMRARAQRAVASLLDKYDGTVLVVGHAATVAAASLIDERVPSIECPLCALFLLEHDGSRWHLSLNGEVDHVGSRMACFEFP
jgi:broad specificity phosphatase PhoE